MSSSQKHLNEYESGPRPPVPGQESRTTKMTEGPSLDYCSRTSPPPYFKWHQSLHSLLEDPEGVELFNRYVKSEGSEHSDRLNFYFACEGLKQKTEYEEIKRTVEAIYKFIRKSRLTLPNDLRRMIKAGLRNEIMLTSNIYDSMQQEIIRIINDTTYPSFLQSELYIQYVAQLQNATIGPAPPSTSASSSSSGSGTQERMPQCSTLPTLHEDTELAMGESLSLPPGDGHTPNEMPIRLTKDLLLATQRRRLDVRPPGAIGYSVYNATYSSSYNPVSRQDSELQSCSSGGRTDSDTKSMSSSRDGRPHVQRRQSSIESKAMKQNALMNKEVNTFAVIPRTQRMGSTEHWPLRTEELLSKVIPKLEQFKKEQDINEKLKRRLQEEDTFDMNSRQNYRHQGQALTDAILKKLPPVDDNDQSILDDHVSRVWSDLTPHRSPGTISPCPIMARRRTHDSGISGDSASSLGGQSIRHSKSMPEHASTSRRLTNKWPSMNTDSGISLFSADTTLKSRENASRSRSMGIDAASTSTAFQLEEARRRLEDETRRSRRYSQHPQMLSSQQSQQQQLPPPPSLQLQLPPQHQQQIMSSPSMSRPPHDSTIAVYTFCDEDLPYRSKLPGTQPTLRQFKDYLPKKGNFRFFFKTVCEDLDNSIIHEEITNDNEILPLFEGKVMGLVKPFE